MKPGIPSRVHVVVVCVSKGSLHSLYGKDGYAVSQVLQGLGSVSFDVMLVAIATTVITSS